ncbi:helix-turn-helix transcriptional regulator [Neptuniibacter sp. CAU 1671]|uniref:helix-turn-helix domain-containing protein n=1 Tax=Neptuniibacter sp. CAU 1671 TaxID=3032593 RepID=UPI0023DBC5C7|nr:helix-turn-helix transcriptional regulator [Neptuniibacter sp. CAU 1671]MDF2180969.1 helix-turn-helix transcriptional regulator [Neptuniibacter sp. CAU 1671]
MSGFGARLKSERIRLGYSQEDFGAVGGVARNAQSNYESGKRAPDTDYLQAIASLEVDIGYLIKGIRTGSLMDDYLSEAEAELISSYRRTTVEQRAVILQVCEAIAAKYESEHSKPGTQFNTQNDGHAHLRLNIERKRLGLTAEQIISTNRMSIGLDQYIDAEEDRVNIVSEWSGVDFAALASLGMDIRYILLGVRSVIIPEPKNAHAQN